MHSNERNLKANLAASYNELVQSFTALSCETIGNYTLGKVVGSGSFGKAYQATHKFLGGKVVLKGTPKSEAPNLAREIHHHRRLHHPHITQLYEVIITENQVWLVLELCSNGELYDYLLDKRQLDESETQRIFAQICGAVAYIHEKGIVHRDLKLENIFLDRKNNAKLGDFGFTRENDKPLLSTWCGSLSYCAPEIVRGDKYQGEAIDIWSLGIILFALLSGHLPFDDDDEGETKRMILHEKQVYPPFFSDEVKQLLDSMLSKVPEERPDILDVLKHSFIDPQASSQFSNLEQQYTPTFTSKMERTILERLSVAGIDTERLTSSVLDYRCDSLCGWWWLSLQRERRRERRYRNMAKRRSTDFTNDSEMLLESRSGRIRDRSRSRSEDTRRPRSAGYKMLGYRFPSAELTPEEIPVESKPTNKPELQPGKPMESPTGHKPGFLAALKSTHKIVAHEISPDRVSTSRQALGQESDAQPALDLTPTASRVRADHMKDSEDRVREPGNRKTGIVQTFKSWWAEQTKSHKVGQSGMPKTSPVLHRKVAQLRPVVVPDTCEPLPAPCITPVQAKRPAYRRRQSSQMSVGSARASSARPSTGRRRRTSPSLKLAPSTSTHGVHQSIRSPSPAGSPFSKVEYRRPEMRRTFSTSSTHSSAASFRGKVKTGHSKASSTSSNSTFASTTTRTIRTPRNPLKVMPSTPPPYMVAHQGGYKERNVFDSSLGAPTTPIAFATRNKAKRGVLLQSKTASRRRINMNEADLNAVQEEASDEEFVDMEDSEAATESPRGSSSRIMPGVIEE